MSLFARLVDGDWDVAEDGYDASFHTKAWMEARFAASQGPKETFEEYRVRKAKEDAEEQAKERELEDADGVESSMYSNTCSMPMQPGLRAWRDGVYFAALC
jgi:hypothetical protein